ncbi:MAG TPA: hypothetical protein VIY29_25980 [Ktedonobacteraceae bacterium]
MSRNKVRTSEDWDDDEYASGETYIPAPRRQHRRQRSVWPWLLLGCAGGIIILVLTAVIIVLLAVRSATNGGSVPILPGIPSNQSTYSKQSQQTLPISSLTQVQVHNQIGNVTITADPSATNATITTVKNAKAASSDDANKEFNAISVQVQAPVAPNYILSIDAKVPDTGSLFGSHTDSVDLNIILPTTALAPQSSITTTTTPATPTNAPLPSFTLNADNSIGNINVSGFKGILLLKDDIGDITVDHITLFDTSRLLTGTGKVSFNGELNTIPLINGSTPRYKLQSETGTVDATLSGDSNVILDAYTNTGTITSDFPIKVTTSDQSASFFGPLNTSTPSGSAVPVLTLHVGTGNVLIHRA